MAASTVFAFLIAVSTYFVFLLFSSPSKSHFHSLFLSPSFSDNSSISLHLRALTCRPHVAGSPENSAVAAYVLSTLTSYAVESHIAEYHVSLTYPVHRSLILTPGEGNTPIDFALKQEPAGENPHADEVMPTFHAYAKSGNVSGPVVYANYGRVEDFVTLKEMGVNVSGAVVLARYGQIYRGDIVQNANDKKDYGGDEWFPADKWMPPSGVQVGTVYNGLGDPTTPGWASVDGCERFSEDAAEKSRDFPAIPSLPISAADGEAIMKSIGGDLAKEDWRGRDDGPVYRMGPGPAILNLSYSGKHVIAMIENVIGMIRGEEEPDRFVIVGNHQDAWTFGAVDPNSGTAVLLEIAQRLEKLQRRGWKPRRTIILCIWDAEEYGLIGSTEWVEENRELLSSKAVAYLNADCAVSGPGFYSSATPQLDELIKDAARKVPDPDNSTRSIYESWVGSSKSPVIGRLGGGGSDYASFVQHVGVPASDMHFGQGYPVYHSMYDDFTWMEKFGDPSFQRHVAVASVLGLVALRLADEVILPFDYLSYASELQKSVEELQSETSGHNIDLSPLLKSIGDLSKAAEGINREKQAMIEGDKGWKTMWWKEPLKERELNDRLMMAERALTDPDGLSERTWYKHLIYGPSKHDDYGSKSFPGVDDALENAKRLNTEESWQSVRHEIWRVSRAIRHSSLVLMAQLTSCRCLITSSL
ncbi:PREDICTED: LOW QUALITY PROTEIN: probable glutamate carboxypeptidase 2 [Tarenaya hassleriana]|uniref:LOW QUALITY PROTEIN: probable glutamate carboxypeptidase 2 n=1 Tax=Tarenaya hassleriana TaxID=28532 RepID=UPI00053C67B7|nr:PREDICTED: LOW QUALITY PROTEIN: probable glutamate carboxypeptidase 2 [Tarenaya hassleriana]